MNGLGAWDDERETVDIPALRFATIAGNVAGNLTVTDIELGDKLIGVVNVAAAGANLVEEFTVSAADTINNDNGTNTTGMLLLVVWVAKNISGGPLSRQRK